MLVSLGTHLEIWTTPRIHSMRLGFSKGWGPSSDVIQAPVAAGVVAPVEWMPWWPPRRRLRSNGMMLCTALLWVPAGFLPRHPWTCTRWTECGCDPLGPGRGSRHCSFVMNPPVAERAAQDMSCSALQLALLYRPLCERLPQSSRARSQVRAPTSGLVSGLAEAVPHILLALPHSIAKPRGRQLSQFLGHGHSDCTIAALSCCAWPQLFTSRMVAPASSALFALAKDLHYLLKASLLPFPRGSVIASDCTMA